MTREPRLSSGDALANLKTDEGRLDRVSPLESWEGSTNIELAVVGERVYLQRVTLDADEPVSRRIEPGGRDMLDRFRGLEKGNDERVLAYAKAFGLLGLCSEHERPATHDRGCTPADREPVDEWRRWVGAVNVVLRTAQALHAGQRVTQDDRSALVAFHRATGGARWGGAPPVGVDDYATRPRGKPGASDKPNLATEVNRWISLAGVSLEYRWGPSEKSPGLSYRAPSLFGALTLQLAAAAARVAGYTKLCEGDGATCLGYFLPSRTSDRYCSECQEAGVPAKIRGRRREARKRAGG